MIIMKTLSRDLIATGFSVLRILQIL